MSPSHDLGCVLRTRFPPDVARGAARALPLEPLANGYQSLYVTDACGLGLDAGNLGLLAAWAFADGIGQPFDWVVGVLTMS